MSRKIAFTALSLVVVLGGTSGAMAASKKHNEGRQAYGTAVVDPRHASQGGSHPTACDADPQCNGWALWLEEVSAGKLKN
jgi:hypothetical protein